MAEPNRVMQYVIEKGIPLCPRKCVYPFIEMEIGDSFAAPRNKQQSINYMAGQWAKRTGRKFAIRKISEEQCRCWRVK